MMLIPNIGLTLISIILTFLCILILIFYFKLKNILVKQRVQNIEDLLRSFAAPHVSGKWGELQLYRLIELTGMKEYCEYSRQISTSQGKPDLVIKLSNGGLVFVDSKAPIKDYLQALNSKNIKLFKKHGQAIRNHINLLSAKGYWKHEGSPCMVIMFIPSETLWLSAIRNNTRIAEDAIKANIIIATPMTLVALLRTIKFGWRNMNYFGLVDHKKIQQSIEEISQDINNNIHNLSNQRSSNLDLLKKIKIIEKILNRN